MTGNYSERFYSRNAAGSARSAREVAALLSELLSPKSVLDIGCGTGVWMEAFVEHGATHVHGVDGDWSPLSERGPELFSAVNFENLVEPGAVKLSRDKYDIVISIEFLEHISQNKSEILVDFICSKGDTLLVSAAIPLQGGEHHVNEQWPEYWIEKFRARGFYPFDALRLALWRNKGIHSWCRQNFILFFREIPDNVREWGERLAIADLYSPSARVHPEFYAKKVGRIDYLFSDPFGFLQLLMKERKSREVGIPPIRNLDWGTPNDG